MGEASGVSQQASVMKRASRAQNDMSELRGNVHLLYITVVCLDNIIYLLCFLLPLGSTREEFEIIAPHNLADDESWLNSRVYKA